MRLYLCGGKIYKLDLLLSAYWSPFPKNEESCLVLEFVNASNTSGIHAEWLADGPDARALWDYLCANAANKLPKKKEAPSDLLARLALIALGYADECPCRGEPHLEMCRECTESRAAVAEFNALISCVPPAPEAP